MFLLENVSFFCVPCPCPGCKRECIKSGWKEREDDDIFESKSNYNSEQMGSQLPITTMNDLRGSKLAAVERGHGHELE